VPRQRGHAQFERERISTDDSDESRMIWDVKWGSLAATATYLVQKIKMLTTAHNVPMAASR
jgi:hypothetical protein